MRVGVIDVGTNTTRLLVAEETVGGYRDVDRRLLYTRLGQGVDGRGRIASEALERTLRAVAEFAALAGELGAQRLRLAGTAALRVATNRDDFLEAAARVTGTEPVVLSGAEEARLTFLGTTRDLPDGRYVVCDIGGGSTELVTGLARTAPDGRISLEVGSVRLTERLIHSDPPDPTELSALDEAVDAALARAEAEVPRIGEASLVGVAGTVTTLAALSLGLDSYDPARTHGARLARSDVDALYRSLAGMTVAEREAIPVMPEGRADIILAGTGLLARLMARWSFEEVTVSERDILDGLALELLGS